MVKKSQVKVGDKVIGNKNTGNGFSVDLNGRVGTVTKINSYIWVQFEGHVVAEPMVVNELDPYVEEVTEEFWTIEELTEWKEAVEQIIALYAVGFRFVKE